MIEKKNSESKTSQYIKKRVKKTEKNYEYKKSINYRKLI